MDTLTEDLKKLVKAKDLTLAQAIELSKQEAPKDESAKLPTLLSQMDNINPRSMYDDLVDIRGGPRWGGATVVHLEQKGRGSLLRTTDVNLELTKEGSTEVKEKTKPKTIAALCEAEEGNLTATRWVLLSVSTIERNNRTKKTDWAGKKRKMPKCGKCKLKLKRSSYAGKGYKNGFICNTCGGRSRNAAVQTGARWFCHKCHYDVCFSCCPRFAKRKYRLPTNPTLPETGNVDVPVNPSAKKLLSQFPGTHGANDLEECRIYVCSLRSNEVVHFKTGDRRLLDYIYESNGNEGEKCPVAWNKLVIQALPGHSVRNLKTPMLRHFFAGGTKDKTNLSISLLQVWVRFRPGLFSNKGGLSGPTIKEAKPLIESRAPKHALQIMKQATLDENTVETMTLPSEYSKEMQNLMFLETPGENPCFLCKGTGLRYVAMETVYGKPERSSRHSAAALFAEAEIEDRDDGAGTVRGVDFTDLGERLKADLEYQEGGGKNGEEKGSWGSSLYNKVATGARWATGSHEEDTDGNERKRDDGGDKSMGDSARKPAADDHDEPFKTHSGNKVAPSPEEVLRHQRSEQCEECWVCMGTGKMNNMATAMKRNLDNEKGGEEADECLICYCDPQQYGISTECSHFFCETCIKLQLDTIMNSGKFPGYCPICEANAPKGEAPRYGKITGKAMTFLQRHGIVTKEFQFRFMRKQTEQEGNSFFACPGKCGNYLVDADPTYVLRSSGEVATKIEKCPCGQGVCLQCHEAVPDKKIESHTCPSDKRSRAHDDVATLELMKKLGKKCPNCNMFIVKNSGCDVMMCGDKAHGDLRRAIKNGGCGQTFYWTSLKTFEDTITNLNGKRVRCNPPKKYKNEILAYKKKIGINISAEEEKAAKKFLESGSSGALFKGSYKDRKRVGGALLWDACLRNDRRLVMMMFRRYDYDEHKATRASVDYLVPGMPYPNFGAIFWTFFHFPFYPIFFLISVIGCKSRVGVSRRVMIWDDMWFAHLFLYTFMWWSMVYWFGGFAYPLVDHQFPTGLVFGIFFCLPASSWAAFLGITGSFNTPLTIAARLGHDDIVQLLLLHGADADRASSADMTPGLAAAVNPNCYSRRRVVRALLRYRPGAMDRARNTCTPNSLAIATCRIPHRCRAADVKRLFKTSLCSLFAVGLALVLELTTGHGRCNTVKENFCNNRSNTKPFKLDFVYPPDSSDRRLFSRHRGDHWLEPAVAVSKRPAHGLRRLIDQKCRVRFYNVDGCTANQDCERVTFRAKKKIEDVQCCGSSGECKVRENGDQYFSMGEWNLPNRCEKAKFVRVSSGCSIKLDIYDKGVKEGTAMHTGLENEQKIKRFRVVPRLKTVTVIDKINIDGWFKIEKPEKIRCADRICDVVKDADKCCRAKCSTIADPATFCKGSGEKLIKSADSFLCEGPVCDRKRAGDINQCCQRQTCGSSLWDYPNLCNAIGRTGIKISQKQRRCAEFSCLSKADIETCCESTCGQIPVAHQAQFCNNYAYRNRYTFVYKNWLLYPRPDIVIPRLYNFYTLEFDVLWRVKKTAQENNLDLLFQVHGSDRDSYFNGPRKSFPQVNVNTVTGEVLIYHQQRSFGLLVRLALGIKSRIKLRLQGTSFKVWQDDALAINANVNRVDLNDRRPHGVMAIYNSRTLNWGYRNRVRIANFTMNGGGPLKDDADKIFCGVTENDHICKEKRDRAKCCR
jgi:hypothetical protein